MLTCLFGLVFVRLFVVVILHLYVPVFARAEFSTRVLVFWLAIAVALSSLYLSKEDSGDIYMASDKSQNTNDISGTLERTGRTTLRNPLEESNSLNLQII